MTAYNRLSYPTRLTVDIHSYCNASCIMCPYPELSKKLPMGKMDWSLYEKIIDDFGEIGRRHEFRGRLGFCVMGEPFVEKDIIPYIQKAMEQNLRINFTTNAALLRPEIVDRLNEIGFSGKFSISCHGIEPDTVKRIMGLDVSKILENVDYLAKNYPTDKLHITAIDVDWPLGERKKVLKHWKRYGIKVHSPIAGSRAGLVEGYEEGHVSDLAGCRSKRPLYHMAVAFNGDVVLCCNDMARQVVVGNLKENTIEEVWNSKRFLTYTDMVYGERPAPDDFICRSCEWAVSTSPRRDRLVKEFHRSKHKFARFVREFFHF